MLAWPLFWSLLPSLLLCLPTAQYLQGLCKVKVFWRPKQHPPVIVGTQSTDVKEIALSSMAQECVVDLASPVSGIRWAVFSRPHPLLDLKGYPPTAVHLCLKTSKQPQAEVTVSYWAHVSSISLNGCL